MYYLTFHREDTHGNRTGESSFHDHEGPLEEAVKEFMITNAYSGTLLITRDEWPTYIKYDITASCGVF